MRICNHWPTDPLQPQEEPKRLHRDAQGDYIDQGFSLWSGSISGIWRYADADPAFHLETDPDSAFHLDTDSDPAFHNDEDPCLSDEVNLLIFVNSFAIGFLSDPHFWYKSR